MQYLLPNKKREIEFDGVSYPIFYLENRPPAMLDRHLAKIFEVETREINQAYNNNQEKFPKSWGFQTTNEEKLKIKNFDLCANLKFTYNPRLYSCEGSNMLATILKSDVATQRAIQIVQAFTYIEKSINKFQDNPMMQMAQTMMQCVTNCLELQEKLEQQELRVNQIEAKQDAILSQSGYYSIMAYAKLNGMNISLKKAIQLGKKATKLSSNLEIEIDKVPDPRFGEVNAYHQSVLKCLFENKNIGVKK